MKKLIFLSLMFSALALGASAQIRESRIDRHRAEHGYREGQLNRMEMYSLGQDHRRVEMAKRRAHRDGFVAPFERRRIQHLKREQRSDAFRYRHNRFRRVI
jgi:hypothetical protein